MNGSSVGTRCLRAALAVVAAMLPLLAAAPTADAHAVLARSSPAAESQLAQSPAAIDLWFTEPLEPDFSSFELFAGDGTSLPVDGIRVDPSDARHMSGLVRSLDPGLYTVVYRTLSTQDGHEWTGSFAFTVLNPDGSVPSGSAFAPDLGGGADAGLVAGRWFAFVGLALLLGGVATTLIAAPPATRGGPDPAAIARTASRRIAPLAIILAAAGGAMQLQSQLDTLGGSIGDLLTNTRFGTYWLTRHAALFAAAIFFALAWVAWRRRRRRAEEALIVGGGIATLGAIFSMSMLSHAAAAPGAFWAVTIDFVHFGIAAAWVGGLATMAVVVFRLHRFRSYAPTPDGAASLVLTTAARFSVAAAAGLYAIVVTGIFRSIGELPTLDALWDTTYGQWLIVKLALVTPMLAIALANRRLLAWWRSGESSARSSARRFRWTVAAEGIVGVAVLFSVGVLGQEATPRGFEPTTSTNVPNPYSAIATQGDVALHLQITPNTVGENEFRLHVYGSRGQDIGDIGRVQLTFAPEASSAGGGERAVLAPEGDGFYSIEGTYFSLGGSWSVAAHVQRPGEDDIAEAFDVAVAEAAGSDERSLFGSIAPQLTANFIGALAVISLALVSALLWPRIRRMGRRPAWAGAIAMFVLFGIGTTLLSSDPTHTHGGGGTAAQNPFPGDPDSIARGEALFAANCAQCHGADGRGDGPAAVGLDPPPAPLTVHVPLHGDGDLFQFISDGIAGTAMPAWADRLSETERWDLVNFLRSRWDATE